MTDINFKSYFDGQLTNRIASRFSVVYPQFDRVQFIREVGDLSSSEMKERVSRLSHALKTCLPDEMEQAIPLVVQAFGPIKNSTPISGFPVWVALQFVEEFGIDTFLPSISAMYTLTQQFSAEFAIRPFIKKYPQRMMPILSTWVSDPNVHVRRLVSEGTRPRLPWASRIQIYIDDPRPIFDLLDKLIDDPHEYVRRSVANNLNDIAKDHPDLVIQWLKIQSTHHHSDNFQWVVRHGCRTLIKAGNQDALTLQGYSNSPEVEICAFSLDKAHLSLGDSLNMAFKIQSTAKAHQKLVVDFAITQQKKRGTSRRVMKWGRINLNAGETVTKERKLAIIPVSVRQY